MPSFTSIFEYTTKFQKVPSTVNFITLQNPKKELIHIISLSLINSMVKIKLTRTFTLQLCDNRESE